MVLMAMAVLGAAAISASARSTSRRSAKLTPALARVLAKNANQHVIVVLKSQLRAAHVGSRSASLRIAAIRAAQAPWSASSPPSTPPTSRATSWSTPCAATVSKGEGPAQAETRRCGGHPRRDDPRRGPPAPPPTARRREGSRPRLRRRSRRTRSPAPAARTARSQLDPEGLSLTNTDSDNPQPADGPLARHHRGGRQGRLDRRRHRPEQRQLHPPERHVGLRPSSAATTRTSPATVPASRPAATRRSSTPTRSPARACTPTTSTASAPSPTRRPATSASRAWRPAPAWSASTCSARFEDTTESNFLQAINYAVETDHVNVINESFGSNPFPDVTALDATKQFNDAAVAAGVVVTRVQRRRRLDQHHRLAVDRPERDRRSARRPDFRFYAQTNYAAARYFATTRLAERQHQLAQLGRVRRDRRHGRPGRPGRSELRLVRRQPGVRRAASTSRASPSDVEEAGGTSESSPFVAGAAALVIQAYRQTHGGATPDARRWSSRSWSARPPTSARPADEQGAGLLNSYKAVQLAESIRTATARRRDRLHAADSRAPSSTRSARPGRPSTSRSRVTNTGQRARRR